VGAFRDMPRTIRILGVLLRLAVAAFAVLPLLTTPRYARFRQSPECVARCQIQNFIQAIGLYRLDRDAPPRRLVDLTSDADGVSDLPYIDRIPPDPWGSPYVYRVGDREAFTIHSLGPDREEGTADDVWPWEAARSGASP
jgi:general secretion pathway protein G